MCGIAGYILTKADGRSASWIEGLLSSVRHRGPDDEGVVLVRRRDRALKYFRTERTLEAFSGRYPRLGCPEKTIEHDLALIHARYAIIDLSPGAHQPFASADGSVVGIVNGEIYNYRELRDELAAAGAMFRTNSDTEVLIEGFRAWGQRLWEKMNGFWAVALYDARDDSVVLARDRIGVAPLYYREIPAGLFFSSSIQGLLELDPAGDEVDEDTILGFAQTGIKDHDDSTCYRQVKSLPAGSAVQFRSGHSLMAAARRRTFWILPRERLKAGDLSLDEAVRDFREIFFNAVELRLRADVRVAFELSGGLDSSSVVAAAAQLRDSRIATYTIKVPEINELPYARAILERYPVDFRVLEELEEDFPERAENFARIMEEPYHSPNIYTHYRMRRAIKEQGVSVVVMGAGGDEVFAGYEGQFWKQAYAQLKAEGHERQADLYELCRRFMTWQRSWVTLGDYLFSPVRWLRERFFPREEVDPWAGMPTRALEYQRGYARLSFQEQSLYHFRTALVPYYMRSNDHFTMAIPVEHRFPFLDYRVVEFGLKLPLPYLFRNGWTKYILRKAMEPYLPSKILWRRRKVGFPFAFPRFLTLHRAFFEPYLEVLKARGFPLDRFGPYPRLLRESPGLLWRLISIAIWTVSRGDRTRLPPPAE